MKEVIINYVLLFFIYSILGWIVEMVYIRYINKKWVNRGMLVGPICPIYGFGCLLLIFLLDRYNKDIFVLFLGGIFICSILEYWTSYFLEKIFKARWWDYSNFKYNINGRICLETMLPFGILGTSIVGVVNPFLLKIVTNFSFNIKMVSSIIMLSIFSIDIITSFKVISTIKGSVNYLNCDNTVEIKEKTKNIFLLNSYLYRRLYKAFPTLFFKVLKINKFLDIKNNMISKKRNIKK